MTRKSLSIIVLFLLVIALSLGVTQHVMKQVPAETANDSPQTPDAYMLNALYLRTDDKGQLQLHLSSPIGHHFHDHDQSTFSHPAITLYHNGEPWVIRAKHAISVDGAKQLQFYDQVVVKRINPNAQTTLLTSSLTLLPKENKIVTKASVVIQQPGLLIQGVGLEADLNNHTVQLQSQVKIEQGTSILIADQVDVYYTQGHGIEKIKATGHFARYETMIHQYANRLQAIAQTIWYHPAQGTVSFEGQATITYHNSVFSGNRFVYYIQTKRLDAKPEHTRQTTIRLEPLKTLINPSK